MEILAFSIKCSILVPLNLVWKRMSQHSHIQFSVILIDSMVFLRENLQWKDMSQILFC